MSTRRIAPAVLGVQPTKADAQVPSFDVVREALGRARRAPSVWNRQPWQWRYDGAELHLFADPERLGGVSDPGGRLMLLSCGMALHHGIVALTGLGWTAHVTEFPTDENALHIASLRFTRTGADGGAILAMFLAMDSRRTETRPLASLGPLSPVPHQLAQCANAHGASLALLDDDGIDAITGAARLPLRSERMSAWRVERDRADVGVLLTESDDPQAWLHAGIALSAIILLATSLNVATCPIIDIDDRPGVRDAARRSRNGHNGSLGNGTESGGYAQAVLRLGHQRYPVLPRSHRRDVREVLRNR